MAFTRPEENQVCVICGEELDPKDPRSFWISASTVACYPCAVRHGGTYDSELEKWQTPPRLSSVKGKKPEED